MAHTITILTILSFAKLRYAVTVGTSVLSFLSRNSLLIDSCKYTEESWTAIDFVRKIE